MRNIHESFCTNGEQIVGSTEKKTYKFLQYIYFINHIHSIIWRPIWYLPRVAYTILCWHRTIRHKTSLPWDKVWDRVFHKEQEKYWKGVKKIFNSNFLSTYYNRKQTVVLKSNNLVATFSQRTFSGRLVNAAPTM